MEHFYNFNKWNTFIILYFNIFYNHSNKTFCHNTTIYIIRLFSFNIAFSTQLNIDVFFLSSVGRWDQVKRDFINGSNILTIYTASKLK